MLKPIQAGAASLAVLLSVCGFNLAWAEEDEADESLETSEEQIELTERYIGQARMAPGSATAFTFAELEVRGVHGLADMIPGNTAGVIVQPSAFSTPSLDLTIRGIGGTTAHQATGESGVGVFIDGAYIARSQGLTLDLLDIESVNVARGSQSVLGGRNTTGGAVFMTSSKPTGEFGLEQKIQFGEVGDEVTSITHINLPKFADILSTKVSFLVNNYDGWVNNDAGGSENFGVRDSQGLRIALGFDEGGPFSYSYSFLDAEIKSSRPYLQDLADSTEIVDAVFIPGIFESEVDVTHHSQTVSLQGERALLTAIIAYREVESVDYVGELLPSEIDQQQFTQRLQLDTSVMDDAVDLTLGLEGFAETVELAETNFQGNAEVSTFAIYAQAMWNMTEAMQLFVGWRETQEEKELESILAANQPRNYREDIEDDSTNYKVSVSVDLNENVRTFIGYSEGYKSGGATFYSDSLREAFGGGFSPYEAETVESLEVGIEGNAFEGRLGFSVVAFSNDIEDKQVAIVDPDNVRLADVVNLAETTTIEGAEVQLSIEVLEGLVLSGLYTYLDTEEATVQDPFDSSTTLTVNAAGAPEHSGSAAIDWAIGDFEAGAVKLHVEYDALSAFHFDSLNPQTGSRDVVNARLSASGFQLEGDTGTIEIGIWVNNLTDDGYLLNSELQNRNSAMPDILGVFGEPRSYGIDFRYEM